MNTRKYHSSGNRCLTINESRTMKKIYSFMVAAVALFAAASCNKELPQENLPTVGETVVYTASTDGADTKAVLNQTTKKSEWVENDAITVHDGEKGWTFTTAKAGANVDFSNSEGFGAYRPVLAIYPAGTYAVDVNDKTVNAYIPTYQPARKGTYNEGAALAVAYSENDQFAFKNAHALIKFTIKGTNIKAVEFYGNNNEAITGNMLVSLNEDNTIKSVVGQDTVFEEGKDNEWTGKGTWVKIYSEDEANGWCFEDGATYYAAVAPTDFTKGVSINYILADDTKIEGAKKTENRVNLTASTILNIGELEYVAPVVEHSGWSLPGGYNGWNTANTFLYEEGDYYVAKNVSGLNLGFKFQHPEFGWKGVGSTDPVTVGEWHKFNGESNISLADDKAYDIYMTKDGSQFQAVVAGSAAPEAPVVVADYWGLIGTMAGSAWGTDLVLTEEGDYLVYKGVTLTTSDEFKFRKNGLWNDQKIAKGALAAANTEYDLVDSGSSNMKVSTAGTYDIYVKKDISKVYFMETGKTPDQAVQPDLSNTYRFYVQNNVGWSTLNFYAWEGYASAGWPGDKMTASADVEGYGNCKYIEITKGVSVVNFIVNNGSEQTKNLKVSGNSNVKELANGDYIYILTSADVQ